MDLKCDNLCFYLAFGYSNLDFVLCKFSGWIMLLNTTVINNCECLQPLLIIASVNKTVFFFLITVE
jgi:hypothetical protein